jgi:hypothetical protein
MSYKAITIAAAIGGGMAMFGAVVVPLLRGIQPVGLPGCIFIAVFGFFFSLWRMRSRRSKG